MFPGFGTLVNASLIVLGSAIGLRSAGHLNPALRRGVVHGIALFSLVLGVRLVVENRPETLKVFLIILTGSAIGYLLDLEGRVESLGREEGFASAAVTSSVLFTVGPLTLLGCILEGTKGDSSLLLSKAVMDGFSSIVLSSTLGRGVLLSAPFVLVFQGGITLLAFLFGEFLQPQSIANSLFIGGGVMILIALRLWGLLKDVSGVNMLPALVIALFV